MRNKEELEIEYLCKEINGKMCKWRHTSRNKDDILFDVIILALPEVGKVSIKPYGYTPEELFEMFSGVGYISSTLETYKAPTFCLCTFEISEKKIEYLWQLARIEESDITTFEDIVGSSYKSLFTPTCPY